MIFPPRCCPYCQRFPTFHTPTRSGGLQPTPCQDRRRNEYRREKRRSDPEYAQVVRDSRRKWRRGSSRISEELPADPPEAAARNRQQQRQRDEKRRVGILVKNTLVLDLKHSAAEVWLVGPLAADLEKNTLVSSKLLILQPPSQATLPRRQHLEKNILMVFCSQPAL